MTWDHTTETDLCCLRNALRANKAEELVLRVRHDPFADALTRREGCEARKEQRERRVSMAKYAVGDNTEVGRVVRALCHAGKILSQRVHEMRIGRQPVHPRAVGGQVCHTISPRGRMFRGLAKEISDCRPQVSRPTEGLEMRRISDDETRLPPLHPDTASTSRASPY
ncbi:hypothetical protein EXIGLDRAFT_202162 [Exidia glandulosa HHB12029]|uniref:Uncharacterized protein n=1 Tax=Exidia glandulosa HHB12029 TaxID=1314781 RepID=A0A165EPZ6_EXIGL|nr:hypothetical protein EXIGLDRAFT_202162 [Exidia glandulosa HHB12029]